MAQLTGTLAEREEWHSKCSIGKKGKKYWACICGAVNDNIGKAKYEWLKQQGAYVWS